MLEPNHIARVLVTVFLLSACTEKNDDAGAAKSQKYYFLESLTLVERAGRVLQASEAAPAQIAPALETLDQGLRLAFQVESKFLDSLDARLGKNYQRYFVEGVETYRLGIEAGDRVEQQAGLQLLRQWAEFWSAAQPTINLKLHAS